MKLTVLLFFSLIFSITECAKILCVFHMSAYSHYQLGNVLAKGLANKGHEVTIISPFTEKDPPKHFKEIILTGELEKAEELKKNMNLMNEKSTLSIVTLISWTSFIGPMLVESTLSHPNVQALLNSDEKFDLVIMEQFGNEAFNGFCHLYNAPCIFVSTVGSHIWTNTKMGNPGPPSYVNDILFLPYTKNLNFLGRVHTSFIYLQNYIMQNTLEIYKQNQLLQKYFPDSPHLSELYYNASLMLLNSHPSTNPAVPLLPNMINIGGYHVTPPKKLPEDLQKFLDQSKEGVILFSMGSNVKASDMPIEKRDALLKAFSKLKQQVLWKWEADSLPGQPKNVKIVKWLPQQSVLAHPNVKLFITHGGLLSTIETIYFGVPIIGIPVFGDQSMNMANAEESGYAISIPFMSLTEELLTEALGKMLSDPSYAENVKKRSEIMHDEPMKPLEKAIFWIEYVLRHKGAPHLKTAALKLTWYQYLLLDVIALCIVVMFATLYLSCKILKRICSRICKAKVGEGKKKN